MEEQGSAAALEAKIPGVAVHVLQNVMDLFEKVGEKSQSAMKAPLAACLLDGLTGPQEEAVSGIPARAVLKAKEGNKWETASPLLDPFAASGKDRKKRARPEKDVRSHADARAHMMAHMQVSKSGDKGTVMRSFFDVEGSFQQYRASGGIAGKTIFTAEWHELGVKKEKKPEFDFFSCGKCKGGFLRINRKTLEVAKLREQLDASIDNREKIRLTACIDNLLLEVQNIELHMNLFTLQRDRYLNQREMLQPGEALILADFVTFDLMQTEEVDGALKLPDLGIVLFMKNADNELVHTYLDCIPLMDQHEQKDFNYVASVVWDLHRAGIFTPFQKLIWWSDTGPVHFRTSSTLRMWQRFQAVTGITVEINFFAPYHGHSLCDGHFGNIKKGVRRGAAHLSGTEGCIDRGIIRRLHFQFVNNLLSAFQIL